MLSLGELATAAQYDLPLIVCVFNDRGYGMLRFIQDMAVGGRRTAWQDCRDGAVVELYLVDGLGHHWPGGRPTPLPLSWVGPFLDSVNATDIMWEFFLQHAR